MLYYLKALLNLLTVDYCWETISFLDARFMTDLVAREMNSMDNTGGFELHEKKVTVFHITISHWTIFCLAAQVWSKYFVRNKSILDNNKALLNQVEALQRSSCKLIEYIHLHIIIQHPRIIKDSVFTLLPNLAHRCQVFQCQCQSDMKMLCALCQGGFPLSFYSVILTHFLPGIEIVRVHIFLHLEYRWPLWASLCPVSTAGVWTLLE